MLLCQLALRGIYNVGKPPHNATAVQRIEKWQNPPCTNHALHAIACKVCLHTCAQHTTEATVMILSASDAA